ncbi:MAG TPA: hypothetical protein VF808_01670 [Ktedonobacterales bacterium]
MPVNVQDVSARGKEREAAYPETVLVALERGGAALLRADTGATIWRRWSGGETTGLAHGGDTVYLAVSTGRWLDHRVTRGATSRPLAPLARDAQGDPIYERDSTGAREYRLRQERMDVGFDLARIEARRTVDGALLWTQRNTSLVGRATIALDAGILAVSASDSPLNEGALFGMDARDGAVRWRRTYAADDDMGLYAAEEAVKPVFPRDLRRAKAQIITARDGRLYVDVQRVSPTGSVGRWLEALDMATGAPLWSREIDLQTQRVTFSWGGELVVDINRTATHAYHLTARDAVDGGLAGELDFQGDFLDVNAAGVAYVLEDEPTGRVAALPVCEEVARRPAGNGSKASPEAAYLWGVYERRNKHRESYIEARALDLETGVTRWRWRSPKNMAALLRLWGVRAPGAFAGGVWREVTSNLRSILRGWRSELTSGQWRHPAELQNVRLDTLGDTVYISGRLGVFALRARDGRLRWSDLPNVDVNIRVPLLASPPRNA